MSDPISASSCLVFWRMPSDAGAALSQGAPPAAVTTTAPSDEKRD